MKVAVCIASYNRAEFLPELFDSLKVQSYRDFTIYIGYDGSTDNSLEVIEGYLDDLPITIVDYTETARIGLNKHRVVARALEDDPSIIQMLDSDDMIEPTFLERSVETIGDADWLMCWGKCFGAREGTIEGKIVPLEELKRHNTLHSWGMFKAHVLRKHNYREGLVFAEDWNLWIRIAQSGYVGTVLEEHLYLQRWHDSNLNATHKYNYAEMRGEVLEGLLPDIKRPYRFHLLGLVHLPVSERYMACAFTQKIVKLSKMLLSLGHDVFVYGAESSDVPCTEFFETHTLKDIRNEWGSGDNRFDVGYDWKKLGFRHDFNKERTRATHIYYANATRAINSHKQKDDFLLLMQGQYQKPVADGVGLYLTCEPGIGYRGSIRPDANRAYSQGPFRAFESAYLQNFTYGSENPGKSINGYYYDRVIPNYFEPKDFPFQHQKDDYFFYIGRMIGRKGVWTAINTTRAIGAKLVLAGQEDDEIPVSSLPPHCEFVGYVGPEERAEWLGRARASFVPTTYLEAFGGTNVEAQLCVLPGQKILGVDSCAIENCKSGDNIFGNSGVTVVEKVFEREFDGQIKDVKAMGLLPVSMTLNHPVLVADIEQTYDAALRKQNKFSYRKQINGASWVAAENLSVGDYVVFPKKSPMVYPKGFNLRQFVVRPTQIEQKRQSWIPLDNTIMRFFGYHVAEGNANNSNCRLSFAEHERSLIDDSKEIIKKYFGYEPYENTVTKNHSTQVVYGGSVIARFLNSLFGKGALNKRIPAWFYGLPTHMIEEFLRAYIAGDGCVTSGKLSISTSSEMLALGLQKLFARLNLFIPITRDRRAGKMMICGRIANQADRYLLRYSRPSLFNPGKSPSGREQYFHLEDSENFYLPIRELNNRAYKGSVYNLKTTSGTYLLSNLSVHNCGTPAITTNFGVFPETILQGITGFRCDTMADFVEAARLAHTLNPKKIRRHAERYLTTNVRWEFQKWFDDLYQLFLSASDSKWKGRGWSYIP